MYRNESCQTLRVKGRIITYNFWYTFYDMHYDIIIKTGYLRTYLQIIARKQLHLHYNH